MKRDLSVIVDRELDSQENWVKIFFTPDIIVDWCLQLCLLATGLQKSITLFSKKNVSIFVEIDKTIHASKRGKVTLEDKTISISLAPNELEMWQHFFLKYYRDGLADVDHLDVELTLGKKRNFTLILMVFETKPPLTGEEAKKLLGLT